MIDRLMHWTDSDREFMRTALQLAARGQGSVEPNPMVGCVIVQGTAVVGEGWHQRFGGPHAEIEALQVAGNAARGAEMYVTLEPCCHHGKTPPCTQAIIAAGIRRVVVAQVDPFSRVAGQGITALKAAGIDVQVGLLDADADELNAPYLKLVTQSRPWVIAKWAMSLDGKIATRTGESRWISNEPSRALVHRIRGRVDGVLVGRGTVEIDDPLLTARPAGPRVASRIVLSSSASLPEPCQLVRTATSAPVIVVTGEAGGREQQELEACPYERVIVPGTTWPERLPVLLDELGRRRMTNVLIEGGAKTLGGFFDAGLVDEVHVFIAPVVIGGQAAPAPIAGRGVERLADAFQIVRPTIEQLAGDIHFWGRVRTGSSGSSSSRA